jgi:hypothetical protein
MAKQSVVEIDIEKQVAGCSRSSRKRFGAIAPAGWSDTDSDSDFEKENASHLVSQQTVCQCEGEGQFLLSACSTEQPK